MVTKIAGKEEKIWRAAMPNEEILEHCSPVEREIMLKVINGLENIDMRLTSLEQIKKSHSDYQRDQEIRSLQTVLKELRERKDDYAAIDFSIRKLTNLVTPILNLFKNIYNPKFQYPESLEAWNFSKKVQKLFRNERVWDIQDLLRLSEKDLMRIPGFGKTCLKEVKHRLSDKGLYLSTTSKSGGIVLDATEDLDNGRYGQIKPEALKEI